MISINNVTKSFGERDLFKNISFTINRGEKIGLVGPNGAGKSTFLGIILGQRQMNSGNVQIPKNIRIGYLPQEFNFKSDTTVLLEALQGDEAIKKLKTEMKDLESKHKQASQRYSDILNELGFLGYFDLEHKAKKILMGLGFKEADFNRSMQELSGGWQMRVMLAKLLTCSYDALFLDEPMNHLDLNAALWFKDYLLGYRGTFIMISHDKDFLNEVTNVTLILENGLLTKMKGSYDEYEKISATRRDYLLRQRNEQDKKRQQLKNFIHRFHAQPSKASQVRSKKKALSMMEEIVVPLDRRHSIRNFKFPQSRKSGHKIISLKNLSKSYGQIEVYKDFDFEITQGERSVLVGENGAGKSTLLKILAGVVDIDGGSRDLGQRVDVGYFSQTRMDVLTAENTVFEEAYQAAAGKVLPESIRTILAAFFFTGDDVEKKVSILSGGEKSRLNLAKLLINPPNFLLLDEPTTHLDVDAVDALIRALSQYEGTLVFISHDIHFVRSIANNIYEVKSGRVRKFPGDFDYYWQSASKDSASQGKKKKTEPVDSSGKGKPKTKVFLDREAQKKRKTENSRLAKNIKLLRKELEGLDVDRNVKIRILSNPKSYHDKEMIMKYGQHLKEIETRIKEINIEIAKLKESFH